MTIEVRSTVRCDVCGVAFPQVFDHAETPRQVRAVTRLDGWQLRRAGTGYVDLCTSCSLVHK